MSFGYSGKKDDMSMKLRAQNMKNARKQTTQLEVDSRRMEERLQELKLAMMNEKEERERNQGVHWQSGQVGKLGNYGDEIVKKSPKLNSAKSQDKKKKLKVLKGDEPIATPERPKGPGTMKYIAENRKVSGKENKLKGPKCGQCEERVAHVSCLECAEDYCAGCFAAFHLKGALKKHRSTPIGASASRTPRAVSSSSSSTPRPPHEDSSRATPTDVAIIMDSSRSSARSHLPASNSPSNHNNNSQMLVPRPPSSGSSRQSSATSHQAESFLLQGDYDERQAALEFQQAIAEWRSGGKQMANNGAAAATVQQKKQVSPARAPVHQMDEGSGTDSIFLESQPVDIQFHGTLTYAEKLMLKKSRRHQLGPVSSDGGSEVTGSSLSDYHLSDIEVINQQALDMDLRESRVDVGSLLSCAHTPLNQADPHRSDSRLSIIELDDRNMKRRSMRGVEQTSEYEVSEVTENEVVPPPTPSALARIKCETLWESRQAFTTPQSSARGPKTEPNKPAQKPKSARKSQQDLTNMDTSNAEILLSGNKSDRNIKRSKENTHIDQSSQNVTVVPSGERNIKSRPASAQKSYRPQSRAKSRNDRPQSRAKSRAESRMSIYGEGTLTKRPSSALKEIAQLANQLTTQIVSNTENRLGLADFFTAGVESEEMPEEQERTLTPTKNRPVSSRPVSARKPLKLTGQVDTGIEKWKISNKLYSMTPRSWKPDFSLADTVPDTQVQGHIGDETVQQMDRLAAHAAEEYVKSARGGEQAEDYVNYGVERLQEALSAEKRNPPVSSSPRRSHASTSLVVKPVSRPNTASSKRPTSSRPTTASKRPLSSRPGTAASGRESRMIVMDGEDLSRYDGTEEPRTQRDEDRETLDQLEWELASQSGRITEDGRISRMLDEDTVGDDQGMESGDSHMMASRVKADQGFDIQNHLRESELMDDFEEMEAAMMEEEEVKRLF